ncbi:MAG: YncE family protein [Reyranella sp.]|nr:YncE family protein [Reyranella sp.]MBL6652512.1 YncE family protein [Reyranella sp.]
MTSPPLRLCSHIALPPNKGSSGFDHAAVHAATGHVYVAHTANSTIDVLDPATAKHLYSIPGLTAVAGALVSDESQLVFTSNRGENTIGMFAPGPDPKVTKIAVGLRPNGLAYDAQRHLLLAANVGDPAVPLSYTLSMVDLDAQTMRSSIEVPGRTRWTVFDAEAQLFYVNIMQPSQIVVVDACQPDRIARTMAIPADGAHGLDFDPVTRRLFCACDAGVLVTLDAGTGKVLNAGKLSGVPDVVWFNPVRRQLYVAVGDPGVVDVFDTTTMKSLGTVATEKGAHTTAFPPTGDSLVAFLPASHRAALYRIEN